MTLEEIPIKSSADLRDGMVLTYNSSPEKRWLIHGNHQHSYEIEYKGQKIPVSNQRRNKIMMRDFDDPNSVPFLGCFDIQPDRYKVFRPTNTPTK